MDNFEDELKRLRPISPHPFLVKRIESELCANTNNRFTKQFSWRPIVRLSWAPIAIFSLLILGIWIFQSGLTQQTALVNEQTKMGNEKHQSKTGDLPKFYPLKNDNYLVAAQEDGIMFSRSSAPLRKVKYRVISSSEWFDDTEKATVQLLSPHEEVVLLPINVY
jgi:hypothetical protein